LAKKYLDDTGLAYLWQKLKAYIASHDTNVNNLSVTNNITAGGTVTAGGKLCVPSPNITNLTFNKTSSAYVEVTVTTASPATWGITAWASDKRLKKNIAKTEVAALETIDKIEITQFDWNDSPDHAPAGIIADQLQEIIPEAVFEVKQGEGAKYDTIKQIDSSKLLPYCIKAIQELKAEIDALKGG